MIGSKLSQQEKEEDYGESLEKEVKALKVSSRKVSQHILLRETDSILTFEEQYQSIIDGMLAVFRGSNSGNFVLIHTILNQITTPECRVEYPRHFPSPVSISAYCEFMKAVFDVCPDGISEVKSVTCNKNSIKLLSRWIGSPAENGTLVDPENELDKLLFLQDAKSGSDGGDISNHILGKRQLVPQALVWTEVTLTIDETTQLVERLFFEALSHELLSPDYVYKPLEFKD